MTPPGDRLRRALTWISDERVANPGARLTALVEDASVRFNLSPAEEQWLLETLRTPAPAPPQG